MARKMVGRSRQIGVVSFITAGMAIAAYGVNAQSTETRPNSPFDNPRNLQVLPSDISPADLRQTMRGFSFATGLNCSDCHVAAEGVPFAEWDFGDDAKRQKRVAREMIKMVAAINSTVDSIDGISAPGQSPVAVQCMTCHRGIAEPRMIEAELDAFKATDDGAGVVARYLELRETYFGGHSYDFTPFTLSEYAESSGQQGHPELALELHKLNVALNPDDAAAHRSMGNTLMRAEDYVGAQAAYRKAVELDPETVFNRRLLERATKAIEGES